MFFKILGGVLGGYNPFGKRSYTPPEVVGHTTDKNGYPVIHVKADNYIDAAKPIEGQTYPGDVSRAVIHHGGRDWTIEVRPWDTKIDPKKMTRDEYQEWIDKQRGC